MTDTYEQLVRARATNIALQHLIRAHRDVLLALIAQPFSPACIAKAKAVASTQIDTALAEQHYEEFMEMWRQVHGEGEAWRGMLERADGYKGPEGEA